MVGRQVVAVLRRPGGELLFDQRSFPILILILILILIPIPIVVVVIFNIIIIIVIKSVIIVVIVIIIIITLWPALPRRPGISPSRPCS